MFFSVKLSTETGAYFVLENCDEHTLATIKYYKRRNLVFEHTFRDQNSVVIDMSKIVIIHATRVK